MVAGDRDHDLKFFNSLVRRQLFRFFFTFSNAHPNGLSVDHTGGFKVAVMIRTPLFDNLITGRGLLCFLEMWKLFAITIAIIRFAKILFFIISVSM